jgi:hypothetical protein
MTRCKQFTCYSDSGAFTPMFQPSPPPVVSTFPTMKRGGAQFSFIFPSCATAAGFFLAFLSRRIHGTIMPVADFRLRPSVTPPTGLMSQPQFEKLNFQTDSNERTIEMKGKRCSTLANLCVVFGYFISQELMDKPRFIKLQRHFSVIDKMLTQSRSSTLLA